MEQEKKKRANKADETEQHFFEIIEVVTADKEIPDDLLFCPVCQGQLKVLVEPGGLGPWCVWIGCENCGDIVHADMAGDPPASWIARDQC